MQSELKSLGSRTRAPHSVPREVESYHAGAVSGDELRVHTGAATGDEDTLSRDRERQGPQAHLHLIFHQVVVPASAAVGTGGLELGVDRLPVVLGLLPFGVLRHATSCTHAATQAISFSVRSGYIGHDATERQRASATGKSPRRYPSHSRAGWRCTGTG